MVHGLRRLAPAAIAASLALTLSAAQDPPRQELPRFRAGANLVRLDAYVAADGQPITDLTINDFEVLEDGRPQKVESFELVRARPPVAQAARVEPNNVQESRAMAADPDARLFVLFLDVWHTHVEGWYRAQNPVINLLDRVIGQDDMVGLMTPEVSARNLTFARRTTTIESMLRENWHWGQRQRVNSPDPREEGFKSCYPDLPRTPTAGLAEALIERWRVRKTLDSLADLIEHLEGIRDERKFVVLLSEGWLLPRQDKTLARVLDPNDPPPGVDPVGVDPNGRLTTARPANYTYYETCERERLELASQDFELDFRMLLQRANRANTSFYTVEPRGLVVFDEDLSSRRATNIVGDAGRLKARHESLHELAIATDGVAIVDAGNLAAALQRMLTDVGAYHLLGYYSTNTRLDGRFRKITVRVKRPGAEVRARPGYLAPTEAEAAAASAARPTSGAAPGSVDASPEVKRALDSLASVRGNLPVRAHAATGAGRIWVTAEIDAATLKNEEWLQGGRARLTVEPERGATAAIEKEVALAPGERSFSVQEGDALAPGRYNIRVSLFPKGSTLPLQTTVDVEVPPAEAMIPASGRLLRRGPATGLEYHGTADARFRRTERIRFEVAKLAEGGTVTARLVNRSGQAMPIAVTVGERVDQGTRLIVADLILAPLAQGDYVIEVAVEKDGKRALAVAGFRIVP